MDKSSTDLYWNERAVSEDDDAKVNIADLAQRELENLFILRNVPAGSRILEVGCGNGFLTGVLRQHAEFVDAFDYSENMIAQARQLREERNNRFFHDNVLEPKSVKPPYDGIVCVRVLINLRNAEEQSRALRNMASWLRPAGRLILVEGFREGFDRLNDLRRRSGITELKPAPINFYSRLDDVMPEIESLFEIGDRFHTGTFDFLTRVVYPALVGADRATAHSEFHQKILPIARSFNPPDLEPLARVHGLVLAKK